MALDEASSTLKSAVVLAGGASLRLLPLTVEIPKAMVMINGRPILEWIVRWLRSHGVKRVVVGVAYQKERIMDYFKAGEQFGLDMVYSEHTVEGGTAQGFRMAISRHVDDQDFFALNGDQITSLDLRLLAGYHLKHRPLATLAVSRLKLPFSQVVFDGEQNITRFVERPSADFYCSAGIYAFNKEILGYIPPTGDIEKSTFPLLTGLRAFPFDGFFVTVNNQKELEEAERDLA